MPKFLLPFGLMLFFIITGILNTNAQDFARDAYIQTDSILATRGIFPGKDGERWSDEKVNLYDTVYWRIINQEVGNALKSGDFSYPEYYLTPFVEGTSKVPHPSRTGWKWLAYKYHIKGSQLSDGCTYHSAYLDFDSVMNLAIEEKYGRDIFFRVNMEADSIDRKGLGLRDPYIEDSSKTKQILMQHFGFVSAMPAESEMQKENRALKFEFKNGKVEQVKICYYTMGLQEDINLLNKSPTLTQKAKKLKWTPPMFLGKPIDGIFVWSIKYNDLYFN